MRSPAKRSRISTSPGSVEAAVMIRQLLPPIVPEPSDRRCSASEKFGKAAKNQQPPAAILTLSSPEIGRAEPSAACADQFLEECCFCRKRISHNSDVFMYGNFGAFCSEVCRLQQIDNDKVAEQAHVKMNGAVGVKWQCE